MGIRVQRWLHRLKGQTTLYQYYATIHFLTCEACLGHHGRIYSRINSAHRPPLHPDCRCGLLEFPLSELEHYKEREGRMREKAQQELKRRKLFRQAGELFSRSPAEALSLFEQAVQIEIYLEEIEELCRRHAEALRASPKLSHRLRDLFLRAYEYKYDRQRYHQMPEGMRSARRAYGLSVIHELFGELIPDHSR